MKQLQTVAIVAGGEIDGIALQDIKKAQFVIGCDKGSLWLINHGIIPDYSIGDFDSVNSQELKIIKGSSKATCIYPKEKDKTDLELSIDYAISLHPKKVIIVGATGTRLDHSFVAVQLLEKCITHKIFAVMKNSKNECMICNSSLIIDKNIQYKYFSILPVSKTVSISLSGCKYPLNRKRIIRGSSYGISNEIVGESAYISVHNGKTLIIRSND
jgi:thiamine pyrophosphokinase